MLRNLVKTAKTVHDQKLDRWGDRGDGHSTNPLPYSAQLAKKKKFQTNLEKKKNGVQLGNPNLSVNQQMYQYMEMCRGVEFRPANVTSKLYCRYSTGYHPMYIIGPLRLEIASIRPYIAVIHNFILDSEIQEVIRTATPRLRRSEMVGSGVNGTLDDRRVSETAWLNETDSLALGEVTKR